MASQYPTPARQRVAVNEMEAPRPQSLSAAAGEPPKPLPARRPQEALPGEQQLAETSPVSEPDPIQQVPDSPDQQRQNRQLEEARDFQNEVDNVPQMTGEGQPAGGTPKQTAEDAAASPTDQSRFPEPPSRLAEPLPAPQADDPSWYSVPKLDALQRATSVEAVMKAGDLPRLPRPSLPDTLPAGFEKGIGYEKTHLGAHELGFPSSAGNLVGASGQTNRFLGPKDTRPPNMRSVEMDVKSALDSGQTVHYRVKPIYDGDAPYPSAFHMQASGTEPDGSPGIRIDTIVRNWTHHPD
jgi:hypothetical protein